MTDNIIKFQPVEVGEGFRFDPDEILEEAKGQGFVSLAVIGLQEDGEFYVAGTSNAGETLVMIEQAKHKIIFGD